MSHYEDRIYGGVLALLLALVLIGGIVISKPGLPMAVVPRDGSQIAVVPKHYLQMAVTTRHYVVPLVIPKHI